ncbi:MAG: AIR synthase-related protein, partial [Candidatus Levyibacteriota bacterium]
MAFRLEISSTVLDTRAQVRSKKFASYGFGGKIKKLAIIDIYTIDKSFSSAQIQKISRMLASPITQKALVRRPSTVKKGGDKRWVIEIGFLPGVTDNIASTTKEMIGDLLGIRFKDNEGIYFSQATIIEGNLTYDNAMMLAQAMANPLIERVTVKQGFENLGIIIPRVKLTARPKASIINLNVSDEELTEIGKSGIKNENGSRRGPLALDLSYMKEIKKYFEKKKRNPTDIELESIAQTWSEHCKHTIFADPIDGLKKGIFKTYIKGATDKIRLEKGKKDFCVSVFTDNSGGIAFDRDYVITHKVETHNSPSALDPFGGAVTGIVGVNRDAMGFGLGAKPVINMYGFCFADPDDKKPLFKDEALTQKMLSPRRILDGVVNGVNYGGNCSGIPTPQGFVYFDDRYKGKPLVFVGTVGLLPRHAGKKTSYKKKAEPGDFIVMVGGRVGKDGIHGATFSSTALDSGSPATAVQIGDPITQKKMSDVLVKEARDLNLYNSITDNGAGGLSCSVAEMAKESGGAAIDLDLVPLKYPGLEPWEIWISESQERMTLSIPPKNWNRFKSLMDKRGVEATIIGKFTASGKCVVSYKKKKIMDIDLHFLHDGLPKRVLTAVRPVIQDKNSKIPKISIQKTMDDMMQRLNLSSTEFIAGQYDHEVQAGSVLKPIVGRGRVISDVSVTRPLLSSQSCVALSQALYPSYTELDPYKMSAACIDSAIRNVVAAGADIEKIALLDNFCWCDSFNPERLGQLTLAAKACYDLALFYKTPFISGKDSMFNDFKGFNEKGKSITISIPPTLLISSLAVISDMTKVASLDVKFPGDSIYVLGETYNELGGSEFLGYVTYQTKKTLYGTVPRVDPKKNKALYKKLHSAIQKNLIAQLTAPVRWTQTVQNMIADGATSFTEVGPGKVLQGLV